MLTRLEFQNLRVLEDVGVDLAPFTVLVGPNGSGKSTVLRGAQIVCRLGLPQIREALESTLPGELDPWVGKEGWICRGSGGPVSLLARHQDGASVRLAVHGPPFRPWYSQLSVTAADGSSVTRTLPASGSEGDHVGSHEAIVSLPRVGRFQFATDRVGHDSYVESVEPTLAPDGDGLPSVLSHIASTEPEVFGAIQEALRRVVPAVKRVKVPRRRLTKYDSETLEWGDNRIAREVPRDVWGNGIEIEFVRHGTLAADEVSEGTLLTLAVLTAVMVPSGPQLLLLDDLDRALHPKAQGELIGALRKVQSERNVQIIATTHSPYLIDHFEPNEVAVMGLGPDGFARCRSLSEHPRFERGSRGLKAGEFWSSVGEDWTAEPSTHGG